MIDANIFNSQVQPTENPVNLLAKLAQYRGIQQEQQLRQQQIQQGQIQQQADSADRAAQAKATTIGADGQAKFDRNVYLSELAKGAGSGRVIGQQGAFLKQDQEAAKTNQETQAAKLANAKQQVQLVGNAANSVLNTAPEMRPQAYTQTLAALHQSGIDTSQMPQQYDEGLVTRYRDMAIDAANQIDQHQKALEYSDKQPGIIADAQQKAKVNAGTNAQGITAEQAQQNATTLRGQNMTSATAQRGQDMQYGSFKADIPAGVTGDKALLYMSPGLAATVQLVGSGKGDYATELSRMPPGTKADFNKALLAAYPNYDQRNFGAGKIAMNTVAKSEVPTNIGNQKVAFNTSIAHSDLLSQAVDAQANGNVQALNSIRNKFNNEFGGTGAVTSQAIANAYSREVSKMLTGGHLTDSEIGTIGKTIDPNAQSPAQLKAVIGAYRALSQSKLDQLNNQENNAVNRVTGGGASQAAASGATHAVKDAAGNIIGYTADGKTMIPVSK